jgi:hypothetical protein
MKVYSDSIKKKDIAVAAYVLYLEFGKESDASNLLNTIMRYEETYHHKIEEEVKMWMENATVRHPQLVIEKLLLVDGANEPNGTPLNSGGGGSVTRTQNILP